ncbi:GspH/FimT family pseudopilin [Alloalcanivorax mobilis]|uniref:GspH/FimT family pseudopilin n=1 Tax=Alloalcanivorax mobilis TaxID=2019569 RepID=UPI001E42C290|nr:GspH/FimT family pseudopilin [Alloalcanivorax mobilis]
MPGGKNNMGGRGKRTPVAAPSHGFTIIELMVTVAVAGVLLAIAVPSFRTLTANNALRSTASDLVTALHTARAQAVNLRAEVRLSASGGDWSDGWLIDYPAGSVETDQSFTAAGGVAVSEDSGLDELIFAPSGMIDNAALFIVCDGRSGETGRRIRLGRFGRIENDFFECDQGP